MDQEELDALGVKPSAYRFDGQDHIKVEWRGDDRWAVIEAGMCLTRSGTWEYEPMPSRRTEAFLKRCRFSLDDALRAAAKAIESNKRQKEELAARQAAATSSASSSQRSPAALSLPTRRTSERPDG
jgi:hypothetical protein